MFAINKKFDWRDKSTVELEKELLGRYGDLFGIVIDKKLEDKIVQDLKNIDGLSKYLQDLMNKDIVRYFSAQDETQRNLIKGSLTRTLYIKNKMTRKKKLDNKRY